MQPGRYAALDIGTVTCRLLVADVGADGALRELAREYRITNLGEGVDATGVLKPEAMRRVTETVRGYLRVLDGLSGPDGARPALTAVATSAVRDAENAAEFEEMLRALGVELAVIPGTKEAALSFKGASCDFAGERLIVVDIGGGSTEVVAGPAGGAPTHAHSFDIGCRRVTEKFLHADPPAPGELDAARAWVAGQMRPYFDELRAAGYDGVRLVAVAGTATTVVSVREAMEVYDGARVHRARVSRADLDAVYDRLRAVDLARRERIVGLDPGRGPVIVAGMLILRTVLDCAGAAEYTASESDILQGIVLDAAQRGGRGGGTRTHKTVVGGF